MLKQTKRFLIAETQGLYFRKPTLDLTAVSSFVFRDGKQRLVHLGM